MNKLIFKDSFNLLCGRKIGSGYSRDVFECKLNDKWVVKVEKQNDYGHERGYSNVHEMDIWRSFCFDKKISEWLAPCKYISDNGHVLIQEKTKPLTPFYIPDKVPTFLTDLKLENFGLINNKIVCHDYAFIIGNPSTRLKKVNWNE